MALSTKNKPKVAPHIKKRQAGHHRISKRYIKSYWPYLPMLLVIILGLSLNIFWSQHGVLGASSDFSPTTLLNDTNQQRLSDKKTPLTLDPLLAEAAQAKAQDMAKRNYWSHNTPDGKSPWTFIAASGYNYQLAGENLAYGFNNADDTIAGWMNSPTHRANILNSDYQNVGFGIASAANYQGSGPQTIIVAEYGAPSSSVANIKFSVPSPAATVGAVDTNIHQEPATKLVSRLELLGPNQPRWTTFAVTIIAATAALVFVIKHGIYLRRIFMRGELYVVHHPLVDILIVGMATAGFVLTRASGIIR